MICISGLSVATLLLILYHRRKNPPPDGKSSEEDRSSSQFYWLSGAALIIPTSLMVSSHRKAYEMSKFDDQEFLSDVFVRVGITFFVFCEPIALVAVVPKLRDGLWISFRELVCKVRLFFTRT